MSRRKELDNIDEKIVSMLVYNARMSYTDIADEIGLARPSVRARIEALEKNGKILGYETLLSDDADKRITYIFNLYIRPYEIKKCLEGFKRIPDIQTVFRAKDGFSCTLVCKSATFERVERIRDALQRFPGVREESFDIVEVSHNNMLKLTAA